MNSITKKIYDIINEVYSGLKTNNFASLGKDGIPMFDAPLIAAAAGDDAYFGFLKEDIGDFYFSPAEVFGLKYGEFVRPEDLRVIAVAFPQSLQAKTANSREYSFPSDLWAVSRGEWELFTNEFSLTLEKALENIGVRAAAADLRSEISKMSSEKHGQASNWSHRHSAFAAGLGTFGLSDGFITEKGMAVRITSAVVEAPMDITERKYSGHYDWCLYYKSGICGACIRRCPVKAISEKGHDKEKCSDYMKLCRENVSESVKKTQYSAVGCGLCQTKVPCMDKRP